MKKLLRFNVVLWVGAALVVFWLLGWPLVQNAWAKSHWKQVPCRLTTDSARYFYEVDGVTYTTTRRDFWEHKVINFKASRPLDLLPDSICWVNPNDPEDVVRFFDAPTNLTNAVGRFASAAVLLATVGLWTFVDARRKRGAGRTKA